MLADMVTPGSRLVDVGCDHGYLSIYLVREGVCPGALAMDIRRGPLKCAEEHIRESGLGDYIEVRLSDGLGAYTAGEADAMVCAGMGGRLMKKILTDSMDKVGRLRELILQPQSELQEFRAFLRTAGFTVVKEGAVCEDGKYYFAMKAVPGFIGRECSDLSSISFCGRADNVIQGVDANKAQALYDMFGELLLRERNPVLLEYLTQRQTYLGRLREDLSLGNSTKATWRCKELEDEIKAVERALSFFDALTTT